MSKSCPHCHQLLPDEMNFCLYCCNRITPVEASPVSPHRVLSPRLCVILSACVLTVLALGLTVTSFAARKEADQSAEESSLQAAASSDFPRFTVGASSGNTKTGSDFPGQSSQHPDTPASESTGQEYTSVMSTAHRLVSSSAQTASRTSSSPPSSATAPEDTSAPESSAAPLIDFDNYSYASPDDFLFTADTDVDFDGIAITKYTGKSSVVRIPPRINGKPVTTIGKAAFYENPGIMHVQIPEGVVYIGVAAFYGCNSLRQVSCPSTLTEIHDDAFRECYQLERVELAEGLCAIRAYVFQDCRNLSQITLPSTVKSISACAFDDTAIKVMTLPVSLYGAALFGYGGWPALTEIRVAEGNADYYAEDGVLFRRYKTFDSLECYPPGKRGKSYTVTGARVGAYSFAGSAYLEEVTLGENVLVNNFAFYQCSKLKTVRFSGKAVGIAGNSFGNCPALTEVFLPETITGEFCSDAFFGSAGLHRLVFPPSLSRMPDDGNLLNGLSNASLYVTAGSPAEAYAQRYELPYTLY